MNTEKDLKPDLSKVDTPVGLALPGSNSGVETTLEDSALGMDASFALDVVVVALLMEATADGWDLHMAVVAVAVWEKLHFGDLIELDAVL